MKAPVKRVRAAKLADAIFTDMDMVVLGWLYDQGFRKKRLEAFFATYAEVSDYYRDRYGTFKNVHYAALKRDLNEIGIRPLKEYAVTVRRADTRKAAIEILEHVDLINLAAARECFGWGFERLKRLYAPLEVCHRIYLITTTKEDQRLILEYREKLRSCGVSIERLEDRADEVLTERELKEHREKMFSQARQICVGKYLGKDSAKDWYDLIRRIDYGERSDELLSEVMENG